MNNITITTELCQEDRNRLDTLIAIGLELAKKNVYDVDVDATALQAAAQKYLADLKQPVQALEFTAVDLSTVTHQDAVETVNVPTAETAHPVDAVDVWSEPASEEPAVSGKLGDKGNEKLFSAVQQKVVKLSAAGKEKKAAVREIVQQYATKVSDIPAADYDNVMEKLAALEG